MRAERGECRIVQVGSLDGTGVLDGVDSCHVSVAADRDGVADELDEADCVVVVGPERSAVLDPLRSLADVSIPIVAVTPDGLSPEEALSAGADDVAPVDAPAELVARRVTGAVDRHRADAEAILSALQATNRRLMSARSPEAVAEIAIETARDVLDHPASGVQRYDPDAEALVPLVWSERVTDLSDGPRTYTDEHPVVWSAFESGEPQYVDDSRDLDADRRPDRELLVRSTMVFPLGDHGVFIVSSTEPSAFEEGDRRFAGLLADDVEAALDRLAHERTLTDLQAVAADLERAERREAVYDRVVEAAERLLSFDHCVLSVEREGVLVPVATSSDAVAAESSRLPVEDSLVGLTYRSGESVVVDDIQEHPVANEPERFVSALSVPVGDAGVLQAGHDCPGHFDERDRERAELLASHAGEALSRIDSDERRREERASFETLFGSVPVPLVHGSLEGDGAVVHNVNDAFEERFGYDADRVVGEHLGPFVLPPGRSEEVTTIEERLRDGKPVERRVTRETADGEGRFILRVLPLERGDDGEAVAVYVDVTELHERERLLTALHEVATDVTDSETPLAVCERTVEAAENLLAFDYCSLALDEDGVLVPTVTTADLPTEWVRPMAHDEGLTGHVFTEGEPAIVDDLQADQFGDPQGPFRSALVLPLGEHGVFAAVAGQTGAFDETDLELAELLVAHATQALDSIEWARDLTTERDRFDALLSVVPDPVVRVKAAAQGPVVVDCNDAFAETFGYDADLLEGRSLTEYLVPAGSPGVPEILDDADDGLRVVDRVLRRTVDGERPFRLRRLTIADGTEALCVYEPLEGAPASGVESHGGRSEDPVASEDGDGADGNGST